MIILLHGFESLFFNARPLNEIFVFWGGYNKNENINFAVCGGCLCQRAKLKVVGYIRSK